MYVIILPYILVKKKHKKIVRLINIWHICVHKLMSLFFFLCRFYFKAYEIKFGCSDARILSWRIIYEVNEIADSSFHCRQSYIRYVLRSTTAYLFDLEEMFLISSFISFRLFVCYMKTEYTN